MIAIEPFSSLLLISRWNVYESEQKITVATPVRSTATAAAPAPAPAAAYLLLLRDILI